MGKMVLHADSKSPWSWDRFGVGDLEFEIWGRGRVCEGEGGHSEGVRGRGSGVREGESAGEGERKNRVFIIFVGPR